MMAYYIYSPSEDALIAPRDRFEDYPKDALICTEDTLAEALKPRYAERLARHNEGLERHNGRVKHPVRLIKMQDLVDAVIRDHTLEQQDWEHPDDTYVRASCQRLMGFADLVENIAREAFGF